MTSSQKARANLWELFPYNWIVSIRISSTSLILSPHQGPYLRVTVTTGCYRESRTRTQVLVPGTLLHNPTIEQ